MTNIVSQQAELTLKCLIVDDEENAIDGVVDYLQDIEGIEVNETEYVLVRINKEN